MRHKSTLSAVLGTLLCIVCLWTSSQAQQQTQNDPQPIYNAGGLNGPAQKTGKGELTECWGLTQVHYRFLQRNFCLVNKLASLILFEQFGSEEQNSLTFAF